MKRIGLFIVFLWVFPQRMHKFMNLDFLLVEATPLQTLVPPISSMPILLYWDLIYNGTLPPAMPSVASFMRSTLKNNDIYSSDLVVFEGF